MSKYTPGPWFAVLSTYGDSYNYNMVGTRPDAHTGHPYEPEDGAICVLDDGEYIENPNKEADAKLIAKAPELVDVLKALRERVRIVLGWSTVKQLTLEDEFADELKEVERVLQEAGVEL